MKIRFLINGLGSSKMRGTQVAHMLADRGYDSATVTTLEGLRDAVVIVVKQGDYYEMAKAKLRGCKIVFDVVDKLARPCYPDELKELDIADRLLFCSQHTANDWCRGTPYAVIPHHWDPEISGQRYDHYPNEPRVGYIGAAFNALHLERFPIVIPVTNPHAWAQYAGLFNIHYDVRKPEDLPHKPATKVVTAAGANAVIMTARSPANLELLGVSYPYYYDNPSPESVLEALRYVLSTFGGPVWESAREIMRDVKNKTALPAIVDQYEEMIKSL